MTVSISPRYPARIDDTFIANASEQVRAMQKAGASRNEILTRLVTAGEYVGGSGAVVSILALDEEGLLRNAASPNLPADYLAAIDRIKPNANLGTCAAAAATGSVVFTPDFCADEKWAELRHLPTALGFRGAWSMPIKSADGRVLGTFGTYYRDHRHPSMEEQFGVAALAKAAALALVS
jgi:GAF domain-containing protein